MHMQSRYARFLVLSAGRFMSSLGEQGSLHPADVIAALSKRGISLRGLAARSSISSAGLSNALRRPSERAERIIATALDTTPAQLWPSRFDGNGKRVVSRGSWRGSRHRIAS